MSTLQIAHGLYAWQVGFEDGSQRMMLASSLSSLTAGILPSPVTSALRLGAIDGETPVPTLTSLTPNTAALGSPSFTLHVHGAHFRPEDQILWNGSPEPTSFVSDGELTTDVNMDTAIVAVPIPVAVRTLAGQDSNILTFTLTPAA